MKKLVFIILMSVSVPVMGQLSLINVGTTAGDKTGDTPRAAGIKMNAAITQLNDNVDLSDVALLKHPTINTQVDSYTLVLTDDGKIITMNKGSATNLTIPLNSSVPFEVGTQITIACLGAGQTTIVATGGVTTISQGSNLAITVKSAATLIKLATDTWFITGALE